MVIGDMILANEVIGTTNSQMVLNNPNNIFTVLSTPAFITFGVVLVVSGIDLTKEHKLTLEFKEVIGESNPEVIFNEILPGDLNRTDPNATLSANISLRNIRINNIGYHEVVFLLDNEKLTKSTINIVKAD